jgi:hypothetical protein
MRSAVRVRSSALCALALKHEAEKPRFTTFAQGSQLEHDDLEEIPGIGPETLEKIAPFATV